MFSIVNDNGINNGRDLLASVKKRVEVDTEKPSSWSSKRSPRSGFLLSLGSAFFSSTTS